MNDTRRLMISLEPAFGNVDMVRAAIRGICTDFFQLPENSASIMDFCLIVTELMNDAVKHAKTSVLDVELLLSDREAIFHLMADDASDPTAETVLPSTESDGEFPDDGYGIALIRLLSNGMEYEHLKNRNTVSLRKRLAEQEQ